MPINIDDLEDSCQCDVSIDVDPFLIRIDFSRLPSQEVLKDLRSLESKPGVTIASHF